MKRGGKMKDSQRHRHRQRLWCAFGNEPNPAELALLLSTNNTSRAIGVWQNLYGLPVTLSPQCNHQLPQLGQVIRVDFLRIDATQSFQKLDVLLHVLRMPNLNISRIVKGQNDSWWKNEYLSGEGEARSVRIRMRFGQQRVEPLSMRKTLCSSFHHQIAMGTYIMWLQKGNLFLTRIFTQLLLFFFAKSEFTLKIDRLKEVCGKSVTYHKSFELLFQIFIIDFKDKVGIIFIRISRSGLSLFVPFPSETGQGSFHPVFDIFHLKDMG